MRIENTDVDTTCPWPDTISLIQGGRAGLVLRPTIKGGPYRTAFVEVFSDEAGFVRGEGLTVTDAELGAWAAYQQRVKCPGHEYEARGYRNGAGFCKHCSQFASGVFTPQQLGCFCKTCGVPTFWSRIGDDLYCQDHATDPDTLWLKQRRLRETAGTDETVTGSRLGDLFERLALPAEAE